MTKTGVGIRAIHRRSGRDRDGLLLLYGNGWGQRWQIAPREEDHARSEAARVGRGSTGSILVLDAGTEETAILVVAWSMVAAAVVLESHQDRGDATSSGRYASPTP